MGSPSAVIGYRSRMTRRLAAAVLFLTVVVGGCGSDGIDVGTTSSTATTAPAGALPTVTGEFGKAATITLPSAKPSPFSATVLTEGTGRVVTKGDLLIAHYVGMNWRDKAVFDESFSRGAPNNFPIGVGQVVPGWDEGLVGKKVGSRVLLVLPPEKGYGAAGQPAAGILPTDTLVFSVDILSTIAANESAKGTPVEPSQGLPTVTLQGGIPTVTIPKGVAPPKQAVTQPLIEGKGPKVAARQTVIVQYVGVIFGSGKIFDSSWQRGAPASFPIGVGQVIKGWDDAIVDAKVGSRLLLLIPPSAGYGNDGNPQAGIKGDDTLVFVVDILAAT